MRISSKVSLGSLFLLLAGAVYAQTKGRWEIAELRGPGPAISYVHFSSDEDGLIAGEAGFIRYTRDEGETWHPPNNPLLSGKQFREDIVAGTRRSRTYYLLTDQHLLRSKSNGESWEIIERPLSPELLRDSLNPGGVIEYYDISFVSDNEGWVLCGVLRKGKKNDTFLRSYVLHTNNAGESWESRVLRFGQQLTRMHFANSDNGWVVGEGGVILHTGDGGQSWQQQPYPTSEQGKATGPGPKLMDVNFKDKKGIVVGLQGVVLRTEDGGRQWHLIKLPDLQTWGERPNLIRVQMVDEEKAWTVGASGLILSTTDGGKSWTPQGSPAKRNLYAISMRDRRRGWAAGEQKTLLRYDAGDD